jgi:LysR family transcriptional regulator, chromosome initiation inhibitor
MAIEQGQIATLVAVIREGSFEGAARATHVTPSAVSQRIKQLEESVGGLVVIRSNPCQPTALGEALYRHGLQIELLEKDLMATIAPEAIDDPSTPIGIAVNADSVATWLLPAVTDFVEQSGFRIEFVIDDQDHTTAWLRSGRVLGAVTAEAQPVRGCRVSPLGIMRYRAVATPAFVRHFFAQGLTAEALTRAPVISYNRKDTLHEKFVAEQGLADANMRAHLLSSPQAIAEATLNGLGWALNPEPLVASALQQQSLVDVLPGRYLDVPLYWQQWALESKSLNALALALRKRATTVLWQSERGDGSGTTVPRDARSAIIAGR